MELSDKLKELQEKGDYLNILITKNKQALEYNTAELNKIVGRMDQLKEFMALGLEIKEIEKNMAGR